eukprot:COSAG02_NODE_52664_length_306_cov_0.995169_2_plen_35_part_01
MRARPQAPRPSPVALPVGLVGTRKKKRGSTPNYAS